MGRTSVYIPNALLDELEVEAKRIGRPIGWIVRECVKAHLITAKPSSISSVEADIKTLGAALKVAYQRRQDMFESLMAQHGADALYLLGGSVHRIERHLGKLKLVPSSFYRYLANPKRLVTKVIAEDGTALTSEKIARLILPGQYTPKVQRVRMLAARVELQMMGDPNE